MLTEGMFYASYVWKLGYSRIDVAALQAKRGVEALFAGMVE
jgi:hypothetical protein